MTKDHVVSAARKVAQEARERAFSDQDPVAVAFDRFADELLDWSDD